MRPEEEFQRAVKFVLEKTQNYIGGNKRTGHAAMEVFLVLNGFEIQAPVGEQEQIILQVSSGEMARDRFTTWLQTHLHRIQ